MARLSSYSKDIAITGDDKLIGSNYGGLDNQGRPIFTTANYKVSDLLTYFQENISTNGINITGLREFQVNLADSLGTYSSDGTLSSLSSAFVNLFASAEAGNKFATSTFQTNMETSVLTFDGSGNATVAEAFANQIMTTTSSDRFATSTYAQNIGSSFGTVASDGTVTLSEAFANSVMTTTSSDRFATSTYAQNLGSSIGTVDSSGNITVSEAFANSVMNTETATDYASSSSVTSLASTVSTKPDIFRQTSAPSTSNAVGSLWYDTDDNNKVYVLVAGDPNVWTLTDDSRIGSLVTSTATINQTLSTHTSDISANATFATGLASSFGTYDATTGEITSLSTSFANAVMTTENTTDYASASSVTSLQSTVSNKPDVFRQDSEPATTYAAGSLWFDTNDENKLYVLVDVNGTKTWEVTTDYSQTNMPSIFRQTEEPSTVGVNNGSLWFDTDDNNKLYVLQSGTWQATIDPRIGNNASNISTLQDDLSDAVTDIGINTSAIGLKPNIYRQDDAPTGTIPALSIWYDTNDSNKAYAYVNSTWVSVEDARVGTLVSSVATAEDDIDTLTTDTIALASRATTLEGQFTFTDGEITGVADALSTSISSAASTAAGAVASDLDKLEAVFSFDGNGDVSGITGSLSTAVTTHATTAITNADLAAAADVTELKTQYTFDGSGNITGVADTLDSAISTAQSSAESASATKIGTLAANFFTGYNTGDGTYTDVGLSQAIQDEISSVISGDGYAAATDLNELTVTVEGSDGTGGLVGSVSALQTTVASKPEIFRQNDAPAVTKPVGSLWFDTDDDNKAYVLIAGTPNVWTVTRDEGLVADIADKPFIFRQDDAPSVTNPVGSLWYDTNDGNKLYVLTSGTPNTWNATVDATIAAAQSAADTAQQTADARPKVFRQISAPSTSEPEYSIWYDTDDSNKTYVLVSSTWTETLDGRVGDLLDFVESSYTLSTDANGVVTGMELYSRSGSNSTVSQVKFTADKFIIKSSTTEATPFILDNSELKLNVPLNGVSGSFIGSISATTGYLGGWVIDSSSIKSPLVSNVHNLQLYSTASNGLLVRDSEGTTSVQIKYGGLSTLTPATTNGITFADVDNVEFGSFSGTITSGVVAASSPESLYKTTGTTYLTGSNIAAGSYTYNITVAAITSALATITGTAKTTISLWVEFATDTAFANVIKSALLVSKNQTGAGTITFEETTKEIPLSIDSNITSLYARFYWQRNYAVPSGSSIVYTARTFNISSANANNDLVFSKYKGRTEITNEGFQVINDPSTYFKIDREGYTSADPYVSIGGKLKVDGDVEVTGTINLSGEINNSDVTIDNLIERLGEINSNTYLGNSTGVTFTLRDNLIVDGNLTVNGTTVTVNTTNLSVADNLIHVGDNNNLNTVDLGIIGHYSNDSGVTANHVGLFWDASATKWKFFETYTKDELGSATVDTAHASFSLGDVEAGSFTGSSFIKSGGTSSQFLKADGSVDSNAYITATSLDLQDVTDNGNTTTNAIVVNGNIQSLSQIRAIGWYNTETGSSGDLAFEIGTSGGNAYALSYDRNTSSYGNMNFAAVNFNFDERGGTTTIENNEIWHAGNDGSGSGLDADTVDSKHATDFTLQYVTNNGATTTNAITVGGITSNGNISAGVYGVVASSGSFQTQGVTVGNTSSSGIGTQAGASIHGIETGKSFQIKGYDANSTALTVADSGGTNKLFVVDFTGQGYSYFAEKLSVGSSSLPSEQFKVTGTAAITGNLTAASFVKSGGTGSQFLKADGTVDSSTYLTSYTETDTLATVTSRGATTTSAITVGSITTAGNIVGGNYYSSTGQYTFGTSATEGEYIQRNGNDINFVAGGSTRFHIDGDAGRIGIGITAPNHKVDIYSNENVPLRIHRPNNANLDSSGAWGIGFSTRGDGNTSTTDTRAGIFSYYNGNLFLATGTSDIVSDPDAYARLTITGAGNVGIGTSLPSEMLHIQNSTGANIILNSNTGAANNGIYMSEGGSATPTQNGAYFYYDSSANAVKLDTGTTSLSNRITVLRDNGNVGIGTSSPNADLELGGVGEVIRLSGSATNAYIRNTDGTTNQWFIGSGGNAGLQHYVYQAQPITFHTSGVERLRIDSSGNIRVKGTNTKLAWERASDGAADVVYLTKKEDISSNGNARLQGYDGIVFSTAGTEIERVRIESSGTTHIKATKAYGSQSPILRIQTIPTGTNYTDGSFQNIVFGDETITNGYLGQLAVVQENASASTATSMRFYTNSGGGNGATSEKMRINSSGNVGIGNSVASSFNQRVSAPHLVVGSGSNSAGVTIYSGTTAQGSINFADGTTTTEQYMGGIVYVHGSDNYMVFNTNGASERLRIDSSGNVGIGTNSPANLLHLEGTAATVSATQLTLEGRWAGYGAGIDFVSRTSSGGTRVSMAKITADGEDAWNTTATTQDAGLRFFTTLNGSQSEKMRIDSNGRVGIGTISPSYSLDVSGVANASTSMRSPIFYDSNNTAYYLDAASTSRLNEVDANYLDVVANNAYGVRFWNGSANYKIAMSTSADTTTGGRIAGETTSDYNMYFTMAAGTNRGFVFRNANASTGCVAGIDASGNGRFAGDVIAYASSDERLKDNIKPIENALDKVQQISGVTFNWNDKQDTYEQGKSDIGVIAQEIEAVVPEVVNTRESGYKAVKYEKLVPLLIEAIKEQQKQIDELKSIINNQ